MNIIFKECNPANFSSKTRSDTSIKHIVIHYTSNLGDTAKNNVDYFAREVLKYKASAHYFVDENTVYQSVKDTYIAYHCGTTGKYYHPTCRNLNSVGIEVCMLDKQGNIRYGAVAKAVELTKYLMDKYNIGVDNVVRHYDITHKNCPAPMVENNQLWIDFKNALVENKTDNKNIEKEDDGMVYKYYKDMPVWAQPTVSKLVKLGYIVGEGDGVLNLSDGMLKVLVINDRAGLYK